jgi:hypothetical protein
MPNVLTLQDDVLVVDESQPAAGAATPNSIASFTLTFAA